MKIDRKFLIFIGIIALTIPNANAGRVQCPEGCFCLNGGTTDVDLTPYFNHCLEAAESLHSNHYAMCSFFVYQNTSVLKDSSCSTSYPTATYYTDQFSEIYKDNYFGFYGFKNGEFIYDYYPGSAYNVSVLDLFSCPYTHPHSARGASKLADCFKYDSNGNKIYYGSGQTITCAPGTYLPANATQCSNCSTLFNQVCPGGTFEKKNEIQGLKINCFPGEYLPKDAKKCNTCNTNNYLCMGGIYDYDANHDQGRFQIDGYIASGNHTFTTCQPGYHMPANSTQCSACMGDYACPGGVFYTDATYNVPRGAILCAYGHANETNTACVSDSSLPSYMLTKIEAAAQQQPDMKGQQQPTVTTQLAQKRTQPLKRQSGQSVKIGPQTVAAIKPQTIRPQPTTAEAKDPAKKAEEELELAKKLISSGVTMPAK